MSNYRKILPSQRKRIVEMVKDGATYQETARRFGISASRVGQIIAMVEPKILRADRRYPGVKVLFDHWQVLIDWYDRDDSDGMNGGDVVEWIGMSRDLVKAALKKLEDK